MDDARLVAMEKDIHYIKKESSENKKLILQTQKILDEKFDKFIDKIDQTTLIHEQKIQDIVNDSDNKYASKYVEKAFWWVISIVFGAVITGLLLLLFRF